MSSIPIFGQITFGGPAGFASGRITQHRAASGAGIPPSAAGIVTFGDQTIDAIAAITAPVRYTRPRLTMDGSEIVYTRDSQIAYSEYMKVGQFRTINWKTVGELFAMPTTDTAAPPPTSLPAPPGPPPPPVKAPLAWGNLPVELFLSLGANPLAMKETKLFSGLSYQKSNAGTMSVQGTISAVDMSLKWAQPALCYEIGPFSGKRRGTIVKELAAAVGIDPTTVTVPLGEIVSKPILLSNGSLLQFLETFVEVENWYPFFDELGNLVVIPIEMLPFGQQDWTLDCSLGDFDLDGFQEDPPSLAPTSYYLSGIGPVAVDGPGGAADVTTTTDVSSVFGLYNPLCVRTSGFLQPSGEYATLPAAQFMEVLRTTTVVTQTNGVETLRVVTKMAWYNPRQYDQNYNSSPPGTDYTQAYGDDSFHIWNAERFAEVEQVTAETLVDGNGTIDQQTVTTKSWTVAKAGLFYSGAGRTGLLNAGGRYVYPSGNATGQAGIDPTETYQVSSRTTKQFVYGADGYLQRTVDDAFALFSPQSRSDVPPDNSSVPVPIVPPVPPPTTPPTPIATPLASLLATSIGPNWSKSVGTTISFNLTISASPLNALMGLCTVTGPTGFVTRSADAQPVLGAVFNPIVGAPILTLAPGGEISFDVTLTMPASAPAFDTLGRAINYTVLVGAVLTVPGGSEAVTGNVLSFRLGDRPGGWPPK